MKPYQAIARAFRPQQFADVLQQEAIVTTLLNAMSQGRVAHAYLFSGGRGSGKTTLARLFAKALNCSQRNADGEPCNKCTSCKEITDGISLDLIEIDGASTRGIDDIRQINETVGYSPSAGCYRIYLIDEVHMLTKEAFNALLKTLEEPPPRAKFFFATTEPHKIPDTIKSRCQHFPLKRIAESNIIKKLQSITLTLKASVDEAVFRLIAARSEGSLRDAEGLLDQLLSSTTETVTASGAALFFGMAPETAFAELDKAHESDNLNFAFTLVQELSESGCDLAYVFEQLIHHFRKTLQQILRKEPSVYKQTDALQALEYLLKAQGELKSALNLPLKLEAALLFIIGLHKKLTLGQLVERLEQLEQRLLKPQEPQQPVLPKPKLVQPEMQKAPEAKMIKPVVQQAAPALSNNPALPLSNNRTEVLLPLNKHRTETLLQFAAVELEGTIKRNV